MRMAQTKSDPAEMLRFKMVCDECGSLSIKMPDPKNAPCSTIIRCARCDASRGTLDGLHQLARQGHSDLFEF